MRDTAPEGSAAWATANDHEDTKTHNATVLWIVLTRMGPSLLARESAWEWPCGRRTSTRTRASPSASTRADTSGTCHTGRQDRTAPWRCAAVRCTERCWLRSARETRK